MMLFKTGDRPDRSLGGEFTFDESERREWCFCGYLWGLGRCSHPVAAPLRWELAARAATNTSILCDRSMEREGTLMTVNGQRPPNVKPYSRMAEGTLGFFLDG